MRRTFTLQMYDRIDPDVCEGGDCLGPAPSLKLTTPEDGSPLKKLWTTCEPCARRRFGLSNRRTSGWWRTQPWEIVGINDDLPSISFLSLSDTPDSYLSSPNVGDLVVHPGVLRQAMTDPTEE